MLGYPKQYCLGKLFMHYVHRLPVSGGRCFFIFVVMIISVCGWADTLPEDNPPSDPLQRSNPKLYDLTVSVDIPWNQPYPPEDGASNPIRWPVLPRSNWSFAVEAMPLEAEFKNGQRFIKDADAWRLCKPTTPAGQWELQIPVEKRCYGSLTFQVRLRMNTFASKLDEDIAAKIDWPRQWQGDSLSYLAPSEFVESAEEVFKDAVKDALGDSKNSIPVHYAAKTIIRYCLQHINSDGLYEERSRFNVRGLKVKGAAKTVKDGSGTACDLVCVCIATLRAAGIPARIVVGLTKTNTVGNGSTQPRYIVWGEYALPTAGWVPFDPKRMQGTVDRVPLKDPWQGLGTMQFLNTRVPLAYSFVVGGIKDAYDAIGPWSWVPIYRERPLPVPQDLISMPWYRSSQEEVFVLVPFSPSIQHLGLVFVGSGTNVPMIQSQ